MKIERNAKGEVREDGKLIAKIPQTQSMFAAVCRRDGFVMNGDYSVDENWVYRDGKIVRKQLHEVFGDNWNGGGGVYVWYPSYRETANLEARYWEQVETVQKFYEDVWNPAFNAVMKVRIAHAKINHEFEGDVDPWWKYNASKTGISFDWVKTPKTPKNLKIGQHYYEVDRYSSTVYARRSKFQIALESRLKEELDARTGSYSGCFKVGDFNRIGEAICFVINNRKYWYHIEQNQHGTLTWQILCWPTGVENVIEIN